MPTISVIVPVYNTKEYLRRCLDSILAQTFTDFELLLVDDGSTDESGDICDEYAAKDSRVMVFHQENKGQAAARNLALDWMFANSDSEYISFVDSDDWVHPRYLALLYKASSDYNVNVCQCGHLDTDGTVELPSVEECVEIITPEEQYTQHYSAFVWDKLFRRECFREIRFPEGQIYEDVAIWYKILFAQENLVLVKDVLYYYYTNLESTVHSQWTPPRYAQVEAWDEQLRFLAENENERVREEAVHRSFVVLETQLADVEKSDKISCKVRREYTAVLRKRIRLLLEEYRYTACRLPKYKCYCELAYPVRTWFKKLPRRIKRKFKKVFSQIIKRIMLAIVKPCIVFESYPSFSDNTKPVYDEMVRRGMQKKYRMVWYIDWGKCASINNGETEYWDYQKRNSIHSLIRHYSFLYKTKCIICCNKVLPTSGPQCVTRGNGQRSFYLSHGTPMKSVKDYYTIREGIDFLLSPAKAMNELMAYEFSMDIDRVFASGFPRNDVFSRPPIDLRERIGVPNNTIIIWYPTYRQHIAGNIDIKGNALPIIHEEEHAKKLNETARQNDVLIIMKPHFVQDTSMIRDLKLSNIRFIDDDFFQEFGLTSYEMLAASDALITDYSSVYFDYTLTDKPIGVVWEDIEEYSKFPGFALDLSYYLKGAEKIYTIDELCAFVRNVAAGRDPLREERREIRDVVNISTDGNNAARVADFIIDKANL